MVTEGMSGILTEEEEVAKRKIEKKKAKKVVSGEIKRGDYKGKGIQPAFGDAAAKPAFGDEANKPQFGV